MLDKRAVRTFVVLLILLQIVPVCRADQETTITILHINDTHGRLKPYEIEGKSVGGIARLATLAAELRGRNPDRTLLLHAGDIMSRGDYVTIHYGGQATFDAMQRIGFNAFVPGNGEFYFGVKNLLKQTSRVSFPTVLANVTRKSDDERIFEPYVIIEMAGLRVAILGLGFIRTNLPGGWECHLLDPVETAQKLIPEIERRSDLIIALTHIGFTADKELATRVPEIDVIVGGHSHTKLDRPVLIPRSNGKGNVIIVQAGEYYRYLGKLDLTVVRREDGSCSIIESHGELIPIDETIEKDREIEKLIRRYSEPLSQVICTSEIALSKESHPSSADVAVEAMRTMTGADVAILTTDSVDEQVEAGEIRLMDVYRIHPWRNEIIRFDLTADELARILQTEEVRTSGCSFIKSDSSVSDLRIRGEIPSKNARYKVVMNDHLVSVKPELMKMPMFFTGERVDTALAKYLQKMKRITGE